jgi:hypothetical protein
LDVIAGNVWRDWQFIVLRLVEFFEKSRVTTVLTHAYEGGHSDHDGAAHCVQLAAWLVRRAAPTAIEMPYYHAASKGVVDQGFCDGATGVVSGLSPAQASMQRQMFLAPANEVRSRSLIRGLSAFACRRFPLKRHSHTELVTKGRQACHSGGCRDIRTRDGYRIQWSNRLLDSLPPKLGWPQTTQIGQAEER